MNKLIVAVFDTESQAFKGLTAIKSLHDDGLISVYATAVIAKDKEGKVEVKQEADKGPVGTAIGMLAGGLLGMLAGPAAAAAGAAAAAAATGMAVGSGLGAMTGAMTGSLYDLSEAEIDADLMDRVTESIEPGKAAVLIEADETWEAPIDTRLKEMDAVIFRRNISDISDDYYKRQSDELNAEMEELEQEMEDASDDMKASIQKQMDKVKAKSKALNESIKKKKEHNKNVMDAKKKTLKEQYAKAKDDHKKTVEKRKAKLEEKNKAFEAKLDKAGQDLSGIIL